MAPSRTHKRPAADYRVSKQRRLHDSSTQELTTLNAQLQDKVQELTTVNEDLANLFDSTDIAMVFLDTDLRIKRFTKTASQASTCRRQTPAGL